MSLEVRLRETEAQAATARHRQKEVLAEWRQKHSPATAVRLAFATDEAERLADEVQDLQTEAYAEFYRLQQALESQSA